MISNVRNDQSRYDTFMNDQELLRMFLNVHKFSLPPNGKEIVDNGTKMVGRLKLAGFY